MDGPSASSEHFEGCGPSNDVVPGRVRGFRSMLLDPCLLLAVQFLDDRDDLDDLVDI